MAGKRKIRLNLIPRFPQLSALLVIAVLGLTIFGSLMIYEASAVSALRDFNDKYHFLREQMRWLILSFAVMIIFFAVGYKRLYYLAVPFLLTVIFLLIGVFLPGIGLKVYGARRWLNLGFIIIQPAEIAKLSLTVYLAAWLSVREKGRTGAFLLLMGLVVGLVMLEPDMGTAIVILGIALMMFYASGADLSQLLILVPLSAGLFFLLSVSSPYRMLRILTYLKPANDPLGISYHFRQVLISLGRGGLFGAGLGQSLQKYEYLPEATSDSIFAIVGEEFGFFGSASLIIAFMAVLSLMFRIAKNADDHFGRILAVGIMSWFGLQTVINLGAMSGVFPLTGLPLPFISYGGSSLIALYAAIGLLLSINKTK